MCAFHAEQRAHHEFFLVVHHVLKTRLDADPSGVHVDQLVRLPLIDEQPVHGIHEVVPSGAVHRPIRRQVLLASQDFLDDQIRLAAFGRKPLAQAAQVTKGIAQTVDMVDPHTRAYILQPDANRQFVRGLVETEK